MSEPRRTVEIQGRPVCPACTRILSSPTDRKVIDSLHLDLIAERQRANENKATAQSWEHLSVGLFIFLLASLVGNGWQWMVAR